MATYTDPNAFHNPTEIWPLEGSASPVDEPLDLNGDPAILEAEVDRLVDRMDALNGEELDLINRLGRLRFEQESAGTRVETLRKAAAHSRFRKGRCMLPSLPPDVLAHIIECLSPKHGAHFRLPSRDLWALATTCRALWEHCEPLLYRSISLATRERPHEASAALLLEALNIKPVRWGWIHRLDFATVQGIPAFTSILAGCVNVTTFVARSYSQAIHTPSTVRVLVLTGLPLGVLDDVLPLPSLQHLCIFQPHENAHLEAVFERLARHDSMRRMSMRSLRYDVCDAPIHARMLHRAVDMLGQWAPVLTVSTLMSGRRASHEPDLHQAQEDPLAFPPASPGCRPVTLYLASSADTVRASVFTMVSEGCLEPFDSLRSIHLSCSDHWHRVEVPADLFARMPRWTDECTLHWTTLLDPTDYETPPSSPTHHRFDHILVALARTPDPARVVKRLEVWSEISAHDLEQDVWALGSGCYGLGIDFVRYEQRFVFPADGGLRPSLQLRVFRVLWEDAPHA